MKVLYSELQINNYLPEYLGIISDLHLPPFLSLPFLNVKIFWLYYERRSVVKFQKKPKEEHSENANIFFRLNWFNSRITHIGLISLNSRLATKIVEIHGPVYQKGR